MIAMSVAGSDPTISASLYMQWLYVSPGANLFGAQTSEGVVLDIR